MNYAARLDGARTLLVERSAQALIVTRRDSVRYLTGFAGSFGDAIVTADGAWLVTDGRYGLVAGSLRSPGLEAWIASQGLEAVPAALEDVAGTRGIALFDGESVAVSRSLGWQRAATGWEFVAVEGPLDALRAVKDADELALMSRAAGITDRAWEALQEHLRPGIAEWRLAQQAILLQLEMGAEASAFPPIVASGPNGAFPHHHSGQRLLAEGDLVTVDFGCVVEGYQSDLTRMVVLGEPTELQERMYTVVLEAQLAGCAALRDGVSGDEVDRAARSIIEAAGFGEAFSHGLGHGLGLTKDPPHVRPGYTLRAGNVVTIEPGVYLEGVGGVRIEDLLVVTESGSELLSHAPKPRRIPQPGGGA